jgi:hypothetical protein
MSLSLLCLWVWFAVERPEYMYRVIHVLWKLLQIKISLVFVIEKVNINKGPIQVTLRDLEPAVKGTQAEAATRNWSCSKPSASVSCSRRWNFRKPA